jgi:hypothetical protein
MDSSNELAFSGQFYAYSRSELTARVKYYGDGEE